MMDKPHYHGHRERLRGRFRQAGAEAVSDYELLELVLFRAIPQRDVKPLAKDLIARFGSFPEVISAPPERLAEVKGIGEAAITELKLVHAAASRLAHGRVQKRPVPPLLFFLNGLTGVLSRKFDTLFACRSLLRCAALLDQGGKLLSTHEAVFVHVEIGAVEEFAQHGLHAGGAAGMAARPAQRHVGRALLVVNTGGATGHVRGVADVALDRHVVVRIAL